jgi:ABC-2 type transport system ATP-binding protein
VTGRSRAAGTGGRRRRTRLPVVVAAAILSPALLLAVPGRVHAAAAAYTEHPVTLHASMPDDEGNPVLLDGAVDVPTSGCPCPGVLVNHGFEGSWHSEDGTAHSLAGHGYVVIRYSSRGFGASNGEVDLVGPKERQDMLDAIHWLEDPANPLVGGMVIPDDVGQYGASYGGIHAWNLALLNDPAVRTVIPTAAWSDAYQALLPNDVLRMVYDAGFYATGFAPVAQAIGGNVPALPPDLNYSTEVHKFFAEGLSGAGIADLKAGLDARSPVGRYDQIHIPVFIIQGTNDGLFSQNQAVDAYQQLVARHVPARLYIGGIGHPPSNSDTNSSEAQHIGTEILAWFDHYLKGIDNGVDRALPVEYSSAVYYNNRWDGTTRSAPGYPFGAPARLFLCTTGPRGGTLSDQPCPSAPPALAVNTAVGQGWADEPIGHPTVTSAVEQATGQPPPGPQNYPDTLTYDSPPLTDATTLDSAGVPTFHLQVVSAAEAPASAQAGAAAFQLDPKFFDVAPDGTATEITRGAYAEPLDTNSVAAGAATPQHQATFDAFGLSHVFPAGHVLRVTLSTDDNPYLRPTVNPFAVAVLAGSSLDMPTAGALQPTPPPFGSGTPPPAVPDAPWTPALLLVGGLGCCGALRRLTAR